MRWLCVSPLLLWLWCCGAAERPAPGHPREAAPTAHNAAPAPTPPRPMPPPRASQAPEPAMNAEPAPQSAPQSAPAHDDAEKNEQAVDSVLALSPESSTSLGAPGAGRLQGGVALPVTGPGYRHNPRRPPQARFGTVELVQAIIRAAAAVERELPGSGLTVNDLSLPEGGPIAQHGSHQNGRDADILFYVLDADGNPVPSVGVPIDPRGEGVDFKDLRVADDDMPLRLDVPRTWRFAQALIEHAGRDIQRLFVVEHVRAMLLAHAERIDAPRAARERFALVTCQPGTPHDDHFHLRLYCAPDDIDSGCQDKRPLYPWHRQALRELGLSPVLENLARRARKQRTTQVAARTTTREQARRRAGPMHPRVVRFLDRREQWAEKPSPGRPYCR